MFLMKPRFAQQLLTINPHFHHILTQILCMPQRLYVLKLLPHFWTVKGWVLILFLPVSFTHFINPVLIWQKCCLTATTRQRKNLNLHLILVSDVSLLTIFTSCHYLTLLPSIKGELPIFCLE